MSNDVRTLLQSIGHSQFGYHELRAQEQVHQALSRWHLLQACARGLRSSARPPGVREEGEVPHPELRVAVVSPSGGVGRTTLTANLAHALAQLGEKCLALELDPQNSLRFHFSAEESTADESGVQRCRGIAYLPFGDMPSPRLAELEQLARQSGLRLSEQFQSVTNAGYTFVLADLPSGRSWWLGPAMRWADVVLVILSAQALCCALVPALERWLEEGGSHPPLVRFLINRFDSRHPLERDAVSAVQGLLGERCLPTVVPFDLAVAEALAQGQCVAQRAPHSQVVEALSRVAELLIQGRDPLRK